LPTLDWELISVSNASETGPLVTSGIERLQFLLAIACSPQRQSSIVPATGLFNQKPNQ